MRVSLVSFVYLTVLVAGSLLPAQDHSEVTKAFESGFESQEDFDTVFNFIKPDQDEDRWRQVPWIPGLWEGIQTAEQKKKPMFIWAMNGDPLGCV